MWTSLQGHGDVGAWMATTNSDMVALDGCNTQANYISRATKFHLAPISGARVLQQEIGTWVYIRHSLFGSACPLVVAMGNNIVDHIDANFSTFEQHMNSPLCYTLFAYDLSRVESAYYNTCIRASTSEGINNHGAITPVSFGTLSKELTWGRYTGPHLPASLQQLLITTIGGVDVQHRRWR